MNFQKVISIPFKIFRKNCCKVDFNPMTAIQVLSEIGGDMLAFSTAKHFVHWACCPENDKSAQKVKFTRISRDDSYFKPVLAQVANALIRSKKYPEFSEHYRQIKANCGHKKTIIAICRMLLTVIWHILSDLVPYTSDGFIDHPKTESSKVLTTSICIRTLLYKK